jgi:hypothetical protein
LDQRGSTCVHLSNTRPSLQLFFILLYDNKDRCSHKRYLIFLFLKNNTNMMDWTKRMFAIIKKKTTIIFFENKQSFNGILKNNNSNVFLINSQTR